MTITYYFQQKNQKKLEKLVNDPLFHQIISYFQKHQTEEIILRELKKTFQQKNFEQFLEEMIQYQLIRREDRRYYLEIPFFEAEVSGKIRKVAKSFAQEQADQVENQLFLYGEYLWNSLFQAEEHYFFGVIDATESFFEKQRYGNEQLSFVSIHQKNTQPIDFASYFAAMEETSGENLPEAYQPLQELIGDVDNHYFAAQCYRIIRAVLKNRRIAEKRNIFLEALVMTKQLIKTEEGWQLETPVIQSETADEKPLISSYLAEYDQMADENQRVFSKMTFYQCCLMSYLKEEDSLSYFII
jgi:hypothetical protein